MFKSDDYVRVFDTTLRDGEQAARINLNTQEKLQIAYRLADMRVDVIEAGFPAASLGDMEAVSTIAREVKGPIIAGLARATENDIKKAYEAVKYSDRPRIHTFIATSDIHMKYKLKMTKQEVLEATKRAVSFARSLVDDVEFSAEDASRSDIDFLVEVYKVAVSAGATTLNIPDTVGYAVPEEFYKFVRAIIEGVNCEDVIWSVHCHNDLGMATANSLAAVKAGVRQVECTINGLGERAGNASLEEIVMALKVRKDVFGVETKLDTTKLYGISRMVSRFTGVEVPINKAIVGDNAFSHEAGIHQHGVLSHRATYEIMKPEDVGAPGSELYLGKHSGRHAFKDKLNQLGYRLTPQQFEKAFTIFKELCDKKKVVTDGDIEAIIVDEVLSVAKQKKYELKDFEVHLGSLRATSVIKIFDGEKEIEDAATGNGPVDAGYAAIKRIVGLSPVLVDYHVNAVSKGSDAVGEALVVLEYNGIKAQGRGASTDVIEASFKAYINAINRLYTLLEIKQDKTQKKEAV